jgi:hypothetical protein
MTHERAAALARLLARRWAPISHVSFPTPLQHVVECTRLAVAPDPTWGQGDGRGGEQADGDPELEGARG